MIPASVFTLMEPLVITLNAEKNTISSIPNRVIFFTPKVWAILGVCTKIHPVIKEIKIESVYFILSSCILYVETGDAIFTRECKIDHDFQDGENYKTSPDGWFSIKLDKMESINMNMVNSILVEISGSNIPKFDAEEQSTNLEIDI